MAGIAQIWQTFWWIGLYAAVLLPILYMIFGLAQAMPDEILRWVGGGIGSLGETNANSGIVSSMDSFGRGGGGNAGQVKQATNKARGDAKAKAAADKEREQVQKEQGELRAAQTEYYSNANRQYQSQSGVTPQDAGTAGAVTAVGATVGKGKSGLTGGQGISDDAEDNPQKEIKDDKRSDSSM